MKEENKIVLEDAANNIHNSINSNYNKSKANLERTSSRNNYKSNKKISLPHNLPMHLSRSNALQSSVKTENKLIKHRNNEMLFENNGDASRKNESSHISRSASISLPSLQSLKFSSTATSPSSPSSLSLSSSFAKQKTKSVNTITNVTRNHSQIGKRNDDNCYFDNYWEAQLENALFAGPLGEVIGYVNEGHVIRELARYCDPFGGWWLCVSMCNTEQISSDLWSNVNSSLAWVSLNNSQWFSCATQHVAPPIWKIVHCKANMNVHNNIKSNNRNCTDIDANVLTCQYSHNAFSMQSTFQPTCNASFDGHAKRPLHTQCEQYSHNINTESLVDIYAKYDWYDKETATTQHQRDNLEKSSEANKIIRNHLNDDNNSTQREEYCSGCHLNDIELINYYWSEIDTQLCEWNMRYQHAVEKSIWSRNTSNSIHHNHETRFNVELTSEHHCISETIDELSCCVSEFIQVAEGKVVELINELSLPMEQRQFHRHRVLHGVYYNSDLVFMICEITDNDHDAAAAADDDDNNNKSSKAAKCTINVFRHYEMLSLYAPYHFCYVPLQTIVSFCGYTVRVMAIPPINLESCVYHQRLGTTYSSELEFTNTVTSSSAERHSEHICKEVSSQSSSSEIVARLLAEIEQELHNVYNTNEHSCSYEWKHKSCTFSMSCYAGHDHRLYLLHPWECLPALMTLPVSNYECGIIQERYNVNNTNKHASENVNCRYVSKLMRPELLHKMISIFQSSEDESNDNTHKKSWQLELVKKKQSMKKEYEDSNEYLELLHGNTQYHGNNIEVEIMKRKNCNGDSVVIKRSHIINCKLKVNDYVKQNVITKVAGMLGCLLPIEEPLLASVNCTLCNNEMSNELRFVVCNNTARCCHICQHCYLQRVMTMEIQQNDSCSLPSKFVTTNNAVKLKPTTINFHEKINNASRVILPSKQTCEFEVKKSSVIHDKMESEVMKSNNSNMFDDAVKCNGSARAWNALLLEPDLSTLFHCNGLNMCFLPFVYHRLPQATKFAMAHYCKVEILARCAAHLLRHKLRSAAATPQQALQCTTTFFTSFLETYSESALQFYQKELGAEIDRVYGAAVTPFVTSNISKLLLAEALQLRTGVCLTNSSLNSLRVYDFINL